MRVKWKDIWINDFQKPERSKSTGRMTVPILKKPLDVNICRAILNGMFSSTIKSGLLQRNPVSNATLPKDNRRHTANVSAESEQKLFMKYAQNTRYAPIYELALATGMRSGELRKQHKAKIEDQLLMGQLWTPVPDLENTTMDTYAHVLPDTKANEMKRLYCCPAN